jgi:hypothetical protein
LGIEKDVKLLQPSKAKLPIEVTLFGIEIDVRLLQPEKVDSSIEVTLFGIEAVVRLLQYLNALNVDNQQFKS